MAYNREYSKLLLHMYDENKAKVNRVSSIEEPGFTIVSEESNNGRIKEFKYVCPKCGSGVRVDRDKMRRGLVTEAIVTCPICNGESYVMGIDAFNN